MQIKFKIEERAGKGQCVVADEFAPKGATTWRLNPAGSRIFASRQELEAFLAGQSAAERKDVLEHAFGASEGRVVLLLDGSGMMNHDPRPNTSHDNAQLVERALKDIQPGEEITNDYAQFARVEWFEELCREEGATSCYVFAENYSKA